MERTQPVGAPTLLEMYQAMVLVREVEQALVRLFAENRVPGFLHSYIGEEATAVGVCGALREDDYITSTHRGHGWWSRTRHTAAAGSVPRLWPPWPNAAPAGGLPPWHARRAGRSRAVQPGAGGVRAADAARIVDAVRRTG